MIEKDLKLMEGAGYIWRVSLKNEAGEVLRGDEYAVYGGFGAPWVSERSYAVQEEDGVWLVRMHGVYACNGGRYQLMACCKATGVEWMLATGCVEVERRVGHCGGCCIDAEAGVIECVLHHETLEAEVVLGESTAACVDALARVAAAEEEVQSAKSAAWRAVERAEGEAVKAEKARDGAARSAEDASNCAMTADERMADAEAAAERAKADADEAALALQAVRDSAAKVEARAADAAASAKAAADAASDAIEAAGKAAADAGEAAAAEVAGALAELVKMSGDNNFTGNNTHAGAEVFNGETALNGGITYPGGSTTAAELAAGYFYARRYWELAKDIASLFDGQNIDALPKNSEGLVKLSFPNAAAGKNAFRCCKCYSGMELSLPAVTSQANLEGILCGFHNNNVNGTYGYVTVKLSLPKMTSISLDYPLRLWAKKIIIDAPLATYFKCNARKHGVFGSLPQLKEVVCDNAYYFTVPSDGNRWFVPLTVLVNGYFGKDGVGGYKYRLSADSVFCILGTVPVWEDGEPHALHLNILPKLKDNVDFQARLALALGAQNEDGTYKGSLMREYVAGGSSGADELGAYNDAYVDGKGWQITISYN